MINGLPYNEHVMRTRILEGQTFAGLEHSRHVSTPAWTGYYVRAAGTDLGMAVAQQAPGADDTDAALVAAIREAPSGLA